MKPSNSSIGRGVKKEFVEKFSRFSELDFSNQASSNCDYMLLYRVVTIQPEHCMHSKSTQNVNVHHILGVDVALSYTLPTLPNQGGFKQCLLALLSFLGQNAWSVKQVLPAKPG